MRLLSKKSILVINLLAFCCLLSFSSLIYSCKNSKSKTYSLTGDTIADGKQLVQMHCTGCHELTPTNALTKDVWVYHTLPAMAKYEGISTYGISYFKADSVKTGISMKDWEIIVAYYKKVAPDNLTPASKPDSLRHDWAGFTLKKAQPLSSDMSFTTMIAYNPNDHQIYTSDESTHKLAVWDKYLNGKTISTLPSSAVDAVFTADSARKSAAILTCIGELLPMDFPNGRVLQTALNPPNSSLQVIGSELLRPVQTIHTDFNNDKLIDDVILCQGDKKGNVVLMLQNPDHSYKKSIIADKPGAAQAISGDFNHDGWLDLMVLYGTGDEGLWLYTNNRNGSFTAKALLKFPPVYGSSSFQLKDLDHDGQPDLIYTCGYNYHDSRILKPYHGLYIFKNTGNFNFKKQWFYPINGCTKVIAADFDGDGDEDLATSAFFADFISNPAEGFIYFEQDKPGHFTPHAIPVSKYGRWMSMSVADYNRDGKPDILLGNFAQGLKIQPINGVWDTHLPFIVLQNNFKKTTVSR